MIIILFLFIVIVIFMICRTKEGFWGGYFPTVYVNQPLIRYGRVGLDAATDAPSLLVDPTACNINPCYKRN